MSRIGSAAELADRFSVLGYEIPVSDDLSPLGDPVTVGPFALSNRFTILPMEGWDAEADGRPSALVERRWTNFAAGGASLLWGCEAAAIVPEARANPNQLVIDDATAPAIAKLRKDIHAHHDTLFDRPLVSGLQLTHSGRWSKPAGVFEPKTAYEHDVLDRRVAASSQNCLDDDAVDDLVRTFVQRSILVQQCGFDFVDFKHCHGYFAHEMLSAVSRPGKFGGDFENRTRFTRLVLDGIRSACPELTIAVRLSAYDFLPFESDEAGIGRPASTAQPFRFGAAPDGLEVDLTETFRFIDMLKAAGVSMLSVSAGSPYYNPHIQRPAMYPPSDGYLPPEDPLEGVARMLRVTGEIKKRYPDMLIVGTGYSYLQEWLPQVAAGAASAGLVDSIGLGRMALSYPDLPRDVLEDRPLARKKICRTFSDCTTAPRNGLISGCYPLDPFYKARAEARQLKLIKREG